MIDLQATKQRHIDAQNKRYRERYVLARKLGYDSIEARIISHWSLGRINEQARSDGKLAETSTNITDVTDE